MPHKKLFFALFSALLLAGVGLRVHTVARIPGLAEYDPHFEYAEEVRAHYAAVAAAPYPGLRQKLDGYNFSKSVRGFQNRMRWHPPVYYLSCALAGALSPADAALPVKIFSLLCDLATLWLLFLLLRHFYKDDYELILPALALLLFLPGHISFANLANNDVLFAPVCLLFLLLSLKWTEEPLSPGRVISLSLLCSLLLLIKYPGLVCFIYLHAVLLSLLLRRRLPPARYFRAALAALCLPLALAGWYYWTNYSIWGNALYMPGYSSVREHVYLSFRFIDLLYSQFNNWHESSSILTGFFASFFSFDLINTAAREIAWRNAVFCLALAPLLAGCAGTVLSLKKERYQALNLFLLLSLLSTGSFLWKFNSGAGPLKSCYVMFLAPLYPVYFAEGLGALRARSRPAFYFCLAAVLALCVSVITYYCVFFTSPA
jgi:4-amino-4-deoxy-L-arabinose transferase-like glycosyltransferase